MRKAVAPLAVAVAIVPAGGADGQETGREARLALATAWERMAGWTGEIHGRVRTLGTSAALRGMEKLGVCVDNEDPGGRR